MRKVAGPFESWFDFYFFCYFQFSFKRLFEDERRRGREAYKRLKKYSPALRTTETRNIIKQMDVKKRFRQTEFGISAGLPFFSCRCIQSTNAGISTPARLSRTMFGAWRMLVLLLAVTLDEACQCCTSNSHESHRLHTLEHRISAQDKH